MIIIAIIPLTRLFSNFEIDNMLSGTLSVIWLALPALAWIVNLCTGKRIHPALLYVLMGILGYVVLLVSVWALDAQLEAEMNSYDLDGDGGFSGAELTPEAELAMEEWASDTGRTFAPIFGVPITAIWYTFQFAILFSGEWVIRKCFFRTSPARNEEEAHRRLAVKTPDDGNP